MTVHLSLSSSQLSQLNGQYATSAGPASQSQLGNYVTSVGDGGDAIQNSLDIGSTSQFMQGAQNAAYQSQMAYLTPQFQNDQSNLNSQLAAQGITQGSDAWNRAQSELSRNQTFQQQQAENSAYTQGLQGANTAFGIIQGAGNFANSAQQQGYNEANANAQLANQAATAQTENNQFNASQAQQQGQYNANLNNSATSSQFGNDTTNANLNNAANAQGMTNAFSLYNQPLNTYNQLQSGAQATMPTFSSVPAANAATTDVSGIINNAYANQVGAYNGTMSGLGSLGSAALMYSML